MGVVLDVRLWEIKVLVKNKASNCDKRTIKLKPVLTTDEDSDSKQPRRQTNKQTFEKKNKLIEHVYGLMRICDN